METEKAEKKTSAALAEAKGMPLMTESEQKGFKDYLKALKHEHSEQKKRELQAAGKLPPGIKPPEPLDPNGWDYHVKITDPATGQFVTVPEGWGKWSDKQRQDWYTERAKQ